MHLVFCNLLRGGPALQVFYSPAFSFRGKTAAKEGGCIDFLLPIIMSFLLVSFILLILVIYYHFIDKC